VLPHTHYGLWHRSGVRHLTVVNPAQKTLVGVRGGRWAKVFCVYTVWYPSPQLPPSLRGALALERRHRSFARPARTAGKGRQPQRCLSRKASAMADQEPQREDASKRRREEREKHDGRPPRERPTTASCSGGFSPLLKRARRCLRGQCCGADGERSGVFADGQCRHVFSEPGRL
jgi:hypothetical protein